MPRLLLIVLAGLWAVSCHINEVAEDILELKLNDSLKTCARLDIVLTNLAGTQQYERIWNAAPPDPLKIRHTLTRTRAADFLVKITCVDGVDRVKTIKTIPYRGGSMGTVHVVHGPAARYGITSFKLIDSADSDGDGHFRSYRTVLDVDANTNFDTLRMSLSYQVQGNTKWFPLIPSRMLPITGAVATDTMIQGIEGGAKRVISLKAEIRTAAGDSLDEALIAAIREETPGQDSAGLRWVFRNHTGAFLTLDADVGSQSVSNLTVPRNDSVVIPLASKSAGQKLAYKAVADAPGEPVAWTAETAMEMDRFDVAVEADPSEDHFVLNLVNRSNLTITAIVLNPGKSGEKTYAVGIPTLPENRNLGLFPYATGTTVAFRFDNGGVKTFDTVVFGTHSVYKFRYADFTIDP